MNNKKMFHNFVLFLRRCRFLHKNADASSVVEPDFFAVAGAGENEPAPTLGCCRGSVVAELRQLLLF